ncbi:MAG TPA: GNAT family protein [Caulobacteraceae bacterium]|jgi:ribosomal-protein-alanine N-acetyltransferase|nr:GNAT family protein [Caulobacteraceae bacterium]
MAVLDWISPESAFAVDGERVRLRPPRMGDFGTWLELRRASRAFLQPWEPTWPADDLTRAAFRRRLSVYARDLDLGLGYAFFVFRKSDDRLVGGVNLRDVRRGVAQSGALGYWVGAPYARQGYTLDAVRTVAGFAFHRLGLHRLEAACLPENTASHRLLLKAGFDEEGRARGYLRIDGRWCDHLLFGMVNG